MPDIELTRYVITFDRIGRARGVPPLEVEVASVDQLAQQILQYAGRYLLSEEVEVHVDLAEQMGRIFCGLQSGGTFAIELPAEGWV